MKLLFFDTETTGLNSNTHEIIQLAGIYEVDGKVIDAFNIKIRPNKPEIISEESIKIQNRTLDEIKNWEPRISGFKKLIKFLCKNINQFDKTDKINIVAYNALFDINFLRNFFNEFNNKYYGSFFEQSAIDVYALVMMFKISGIINTKNLKQETICNFFDIQVKNSKTHDALSDIKNLRKLFYTLENRFEIN